MVLRVDIVSRAADVWRGEATAVTVPAVHGELGILPGRQPILAALGAGAVRVTTAAGQELSFDVQGGFATVDSDTVTVVVDNAAARLG